MILGAETVSANDGDWILCRGAGTYSGRCSHKLARLLGNGVFEVQHAGLKMYICSGVSVLLCSKCKTPCLLMCVKEKRLDDTEAFVLDSA